MTATSAPGGRYSHTAVWTGSEMIVWGGATASSFVNDRRALQSGGSTAGRDATGAPTGRSDHTAVWTGSEMIVWGG